MDTIRTEPVGVRTSAGSKKATQTRARRRKRVKQPLTPIRERRRRATRWFVLRVLFLLILVWGIAYSAWFAPWARPVREVKIEMLP